MSVKAIEILKSYFLLGSKPTQGQFEDLIDSFVHKDASIEVDKVNGLDDILQELALKNELETHINNDEVHMTPDERNTWNNKADLNAVYTQDVIDDLLADKANLDEVYTQDQADLLLGNKANNDHSHDGHIHVSEIIASPTGADGEANSFKIYQDGSDTIIDSTADGVNWVTVAMFSRD